MQARFPFASRRIRHVLLLSVAATACAVPLLGAHAEPTSTAMHRVHVMHRSEGGEPYALVRPGSRMDMTRDSANIADIEAVKRNVEGEFLWFRKGGQEYVVQDAAMLERVRQAWAPMEKTGAEMEKLGKEMGRHGEAMGAYGNQMAMAAVTLNKTKMESLGKKMEEAGKPMEAIGKQMEALGDRMEAQQKEADKVTRGIVGESIANGTARPAPKRS